MRLPILLAAAFAMTSASAQTAPPPGAGTAEPKPQDAAVLASVAWLEGCWRGSAGPREFREHWMPLQGAMMVGMSQTVDKGATQSYEFLRIEPRPGGVYYVASPSGKAETAFRFEGMTVDTAMERNDTTFAFVNPGEDFPRLISYRRAKDGWLYATVEGKINGAERKATYPMRRIDCESGDFLLR